MLCKSQAEELIREGSLELFSISFTRDIFTAIRSLGSDSLDYPLLAHELERAGKHVSLGDLMTLDNGVVVEIPMRTRLLRLRELRRLRELAKLGERLAGAPFEIGIKASDVIAQVREQLEAISR